MAKINQNLQRSKIAVRRNWKWGPLSDKQLDVLTWWLPEHPYYNCHTIISDGAIRSGKTLSTAFSYCLWAHSNFDGMLLGMAGKTIGSFRKNVLPDLLPALTAEGFDITERRHENLIMVSKAGKYNTYELFGGRDEASQDLIQGRTLAGMFFDEVVLMPVSFMNQAIGRCSVSGSRLWFTCNPGSPYHELKVNYIDRVANEGYQKTGICHCHFELDDNLNISEEVRHRLKAQYSGLFKMRYIDGLWVLAEGVIYDMFDKDNIIPFERKYPVYYASVDYGTNNPFVCGIFGTDGTTHHLGATYYYDSRKKRKQKTDRQYAADITKFFKDSGLQISEMFVDPSAASFIAECNQTPGLGHIPITKADNTVGDGIRYVSSKIGSKQFLIDPNCREVIQETQTMSWDVKFQRKGLDVPIKENDHGPDMFRYGIYTFDNRPQYEEQTQERYRI